MPRLFWPVTLVLAFTAACIVRADDRIASITVDPASLRMQGPNAAYSLLVTGQTSDGRLVDLTQQARYRSIQPSIATVMEAGLVRAVADGETRIEIETANTKLIVPVTVTGSAQPRVFHFENDIEPILGRFGCNSSGCHGKAEGQNGFKLSVFGFDPVADHAALVKEDRGRRTIATAPEQSLLLRKAAGRMAHGGGTRLAVGSEAYETMRGWIAAGTPFGRNDAPKLERIRVEPRERILSMHGGQQLRVVAHYSDGREIDVTRRARFQSNNDALALVNPSGLVTAFDAPGDAAIMTAYLGEVDVFRVIIPRPATTLTPLPQFNFIDEFVDRKLTKLNIQPSGICDDATFVRRVYLDVIGTMPTAEQARRFLANGQPNKRAKLVEELLHRPEFADYWALKWTDLLRVDRQALGHQNAYAFYQWIRDSIAAGKPLDQFARDVITAEGPLAENGPANFYKVVNKPGEMASSLSQVFLGIRIACAECHHHPFDRWSQTDYFGMQSFFTPVGVRNNPQGEVLLATGDPITTHPRSGEKVFAHALGMTEPKANPAGDRRVELAKWMTAPDNPYFARNLANRLWAHFLGRGLVEPVDDVRATNPPTNPELLDALARNLAENKFDLRKFIGTISASRAYQTSSATNTTNERDEQNYSRALFRPLEAEVLLDMVSQATGVPEKFQGEPAGLRAIQLWDSKVSHYFLKQFGRPVRVSSCECERNHEPGVAQVLHFLNSPE
ncbi:MAG TPA: DUF1549 domain-containing protein, partial [Gemmataceae bacterium]|nr:DUF1549 domain-containing protein [Gemmataceae bacterium]